MLVHAYNITCHIQLARPPSSPDTEVITCDVEELLTTLTDVCSYTIETVPEDVDDCNKVLCLVAVQVRFEFGL